MCFITVWWISIRFGAQSPADCHQQVDICDLDSWWMDWAWQFVLANFDLELYEVLQKPSTVNSVFLDFFKHYYYYFLFYFFLFTILQNNSTDLNSSSVSTNSPFSLLSFCFFPGSSQGRRVVLSGCFDHPTHCYLVGNKTLLRAPLDETVSFLSDMWKCKLTAQRLAGRSTPNSCKMCLTLRFQNERSFYNPVSKKVGTVCKTQIETKCDLQNTEAQSSSVFCISSVILSRTGEGKGKHLLFANIHFNATVKPPKNEISIKNSPVDVLSTVSLTPIQDFTFSSASSIRLWRAALCSFSWLTSCFLLADIFLKISEKDDLTFMLSLNCTLSRGQTSCWREVLTCGTGASLLTWSLRFGTGLAEQDSTLSGSTWDNPPLEVDTYGHWSWPRMLLHTVLPGKCMKTFCQWSDSAGECLRVQFPCLQQMRSGHLWELPWWRDALCQAEGTIRNYQVIGQRLCVWPMKGND